MWRTKLHRSRVAAPTKMLTDRKTESPMLSATVAVWRLWRQFRKGQGKFNFASSDSLEPRKEETRWKISRTTPCNRRTSPTRRVVGREPGLALNAVLPLSEASIGAACGGKNSGAPEGNRNAWKHGNRSAEAEEQLKVIAENSRILRLVDKVRRGVKLRTEEMDEIISYLE